MWSDRDTEDDCLGFSGYVSVLSEVCVEKGLAPLTLGIFGSWGSGKTSLMRMLKKRVEQSNRGKTVKTLWFNAWRYEGKDEAQSALIHAILNKLEEDKSLLQDAAETLKRLKDGASILKLGKFIAKSTLTLTPDIGGLLDCFKEESEKIAETMESFERDFESLVEKMKIDRIVVFIDDLDRCQSEKVVETFETIKLFLNIPACTFVIGADARKIEQAITGVYRVGEQTALSFAEDYLEKIIQIPFRIPEQQLADIECYVAMLVLYRHVQADGWQLLLGERQKLMAHDDRAGQFSQWVVENGSHCPGKKDALKEIAETLPYARILAHGLRGNPRQIKRFLNILSLRQRLARLNNLPVAQDVLVKLLVIEYAWRGFFENLVETYDPGTETSPLLAEIAKARPGEKSDSAMVAAAMELPGLFEFLKQKPSLEGVPLAPYLFLAQTALTTQRGAGLASFDETARALVERIASDDRIPSNAAAKRAVREEKAVVDTVVRQLIPRLIAADEERLRVNLLIGLDTICQKHTEHYAQFLRTLEQVAIPQKGASALAVATIVGNAEKAGQVIPDGLKTKDKGGLVAAAKIGPRPRSRGT